MMPVLHPAILRTFYLNEDMKSYKFLLYAVAAVLPAAVSCNKTVIPAGNSGNGEVTTGKINIRTTVSPIVKAPELGEDGSGNFISGDVFQLSVSGAGFDDIRKNYTVGETELSWSDLELPANPGTVYFSGCYPAGRDGRSGILSCFPQACHRIRVRRHLF